MVPSDFDKTDRSKNGFFDELAIIHDLKRRKPLSSFFELGSAQNELKRGGTEVQQLGRSSTKAHKENHRELGSRELALPPHEQIEGGSSLREHHCAEGSWGEL